MCECVYIIYIYVYVCLRISNVSVKVSWVYDGLWKEYFCVDKKKKNPTDVEKI